MEEQEGPFFKVITSVDCYVEVIDGDDWATVDGMLQIKKKGIVVAMFREWRSFEFVSQ